MQSTRESCKPKRCAKRRNSRKKSLSPSDLKRARDLKSEKLGRRSLSEGSVKVKHRKSNIRRSLTHPFTRSDYTDVPLCQTVHSDVENTAKVQPESDESNLPPTSSDRDTEDDVRQRHLFKPRWDSGSEMDSIISIVRRVSARRRRASQAEWGHNRSPESIEPGDASEREAGRMRPDDYRLVFLSSDSSYRDDTEDTASTASSAAAPAPDDCDWDYFEPGAAAAAAPGPAARAPPRLAPQPQSLSAPLCPRPCSCGAEPRIVAVPVPVPVPVPAALWPALLAFPDGAGREPPPPHWSTYPGFPQLDAAALARLTKAAATAAAGVAATLPRAGPPTVDTIDKAIQSEAIEPDAGRSDNADSILADNKQTDNDSGKCAVEANASDEIKVIAETGTPEISERIETMPDHLEAENAFPSSDDSAESSEDEEGGVCRSYDFKTGAPDEPATSDEDSEDSGGGGGGRFSRVFVVNPADSSSDVEDNADSSGIDCDDGDDKKSDSLEIIAVEVLPDRGQPDVENDPDRCNMNVFRTDNVHEHRSVIPYDSEPHDDNGSVKCVEFVQFCDRSVFQNDVNVEDREHRPLDSIKIFGHLECESNGNINDFHTHSREDGFSSDSSSASDESKVKADKEKSNLSNDDRTSGNFNDVTHEMKSSHSLSTSGLVESKTSLGKIDLFRGIERKLSELLKKESLEERLEEKPQAATAGHVLEGEERGAGGGAPAAAAGATVDRSRPAHADGSARYTSCVMITHDRVSVVTTDTTRLMRDVTVHHTNLQSEPEAGRVRRDDDDERLSDDVPQRPGDGTGAGVTVVSNSDTLSAVVCLEEGLADDDSWVEDVSHDEDARTSPTDSDSGDEAAIGARGEDFIGYCRPSLDFTLHTIVEESCEESEAEHGTKKPRPISATELEKYFFFGLGDGRHPRDDDEHASDTSSVCSEGGESLAGDQQPERTGESDDLASSRLEKYFLSGFMGFNQERRDSDGSGSVGSDSEGRQSPEQRRKRLVRARGTPRSHSSSLDNLLTGEELAQDVPEVSDGSSTETEERHDCSDRIDLQSENKRKKQNKKTRGSPADERRLSTEFAEENRDDTRSVSEGEDGRLTPRPEFPPLGSELSESKKQTSRDSGFVGSCDDLLRNGDSSGDFSRAHEPKMELEEITEEMRPEIEERTDGPPPRLLPNTLSRKDSFNNWSSDEETNLMMTKMRQFFKQMIASGNVRTSTPSCSSSSAGGSAGGRPPKPPQLLYFESELTRLMKTVPGIRDEEVREIVEYLSSEDTWSDSYDSSDYAGSDLEGATGGRSALRRQISESCREIIDEFDRGGAGGAGNGGGAASLERDAAGAYRRLAATLGRAGEGSPPLFGKVMRHIGGRLVALMHEVSAAASPSTDDDSASEPGALARSRSHDVLEAAASRASVASDSERFSWRGSFESALVAADSRGTLGAPEARRSPPADLATQRSHSRSCGAIATSEERLWRARRRASAPDAESEEEQARAGSLPRLPSVAVAAAAAGPVKSARYRAPGFRTAIRAASAPGLHAPRRRRAPAPAHAVHAHPATPAAPASASAPSLQDEVYISECLSPGHATLPRRSSSPIPHDADRDRFSFNKSGLQVISQKYLPRNPCMTRSESMASVYSGAGEGVRGCVAVRGEVQFSLLYNYRLGALEIGVKRCRDLAPVDVKRSRSDPYVKVYLLPDKSKAGKRKTKVKKNTLNPEFEETLRFVQPLPSLSARTLWLSVWHADMFGRNDFLGEVTLPLADVVFDDATPMWYKLQERTEQFEESPGSRGDLVIALKFEIQEGGNSTPSRGKGTLHVLVKEAKNLVATKPNGFDLFCKSYLLPERGRLAKQKTSVCRRTLNPRWEHTFVYRGVTLAELNTRALELSLWDRDRLASNDFMGAVRLSIGSGTYMGASVNWMDSIGKEVTLWQTMMQRPNFWVEGSLPLRAQLSN